MVKDQESIEILLRYTYSCHRSKEGAEIISFSEFFCIAKVFLKYRLMSITRSFYFDPTSIGMIAGLPEALLLENGKRQSVALCQGFTLRSCELSMTGLKDIHR